MTQFEFFSKAYHLASKEYRELRYSIETSGLTVDQYAFEQAIDEYNKWMGDDVFKKHNNISIDINEELLKRGFTLEKDIDGEYKYEIKEEDIFMSVQIMYEHMVKLFIAKDFMQPLYTQSFLYRNFNYKSLLDTIDAYGLGQFRPKIKLKIHTDLYNIVNNKDYIYTYEKDGSICYNLEKGNVLKNLYKVNIRMICCIKTTKGWDIEQEKLDELLELTKQIEGNYKIQINENTRNRI